MTYTVLHPQTIKMLLYTQFIKKNNILTSCFGCIHTAITTSNNKIKDKFVRIWTESNFQDYSHQAVLEREWSESVSKALSHTLLQLLCRLTATLPLPQHHSHPTTTTEQHPCTLWSVFKSKKSCERPQMQSFCFIKVVSPPWAELWKSVGVLQ